MYDTYRQKCGAIAGKCGEIKTVPKQRIYRTTSISSVAATHGTSTLKARQYATSSPTRTFTMDLTPSSSVFQPGISCWRAQKFASLNPEQSFVFQGILDKLGQLSSQAQELSSAITTAEKLKEGADSVYVTCDEKGRVAQGFLRLGRKHLFLYPDDGGSMFEEDILCLLDFYVHESVQRKGLGITLFKSALQSEGVMPTEIAYDRPSPRLSPFLKKHFGLDNGLDQPNRFMVFKEFFGGDSNVGRSNERGA